MRLQTMLKRIAWILLGCIGGSVLGGLAGVGWYNWNHPIPGGDFAEIGVAIQTVFFGCLLGLLLGAIGGFWVGKTCTTMS